jgi:anti-sigma-K factor RskA
MSAPPEFHDTEKAAIAAYALNALDAADARALEAHLAQCAECRAELAELRRAVNGIGLNAIAEEPPAGLRARIVNQAGLTQGTRSARSSTSEKPPASAIVPWMVAAASIALVAASGLYVLMQRQQVVDALNGKAAADARVNTLQTQLSTLQSEVNAQAQRLNVMSAPDAVRIALAGQPDAPKATASVVMSPTRGMVLIASNLPALAAGKTYQLWVVTKQAPVSIGTFEVAADGSVTGTMPISAEASLNPVAVAVTIEPAGGVPSPTGPKVLVGLVR